MKIEAITCNLHRLVVMEFLKKRYEEASQPNLYFFRDANKNEVDLIMVSGPDLWAVEIKSGQTITSDFFKGLTYFGELNQEKNLQKALVYGGDQKQKRSYARVIPWDKLDTLWKT